MVLPAPVRLRVRVPAGWTCLANAPAATADELGWRQFAASQPLPPCTVALAVGPMACWHGRLQTARTSVLLEIAAPASRAGAVADPVRLVEAITTSVHRLEELLNLPLPTEKLSIIFAQDYPVLGFSAPGLITFHHAVLDAASAPSSTPRFTVTIAHELAHAWFGGQIKATRQDAWLLEAAATYLSRQVLATVWPGCDPSQRDLDLPDAGYTHFADQLRGLEPAVGTGGVLAALHRLLTNHAGRAVQLADLKRILPETAASTLQPPKPRHES